MFELFLDGSMMVIRSMFVNLKAFNITVMIIDYLH